MDKASKGLERLMELEKASTRWKELNLPADLTASPVVISNAPPEQRQEIIDLARTLGVARLTFFSLPSNGRRPPQP